MAATKPELLTAGNIAKTLGVPGSKVTKAIQGLKLKPQLKKGGCSYYGMDAVAKIKSSLK